MGRAERRAQEGEKVGGEAHRAGFWGPATGGVEGTPRFPP